VRRGDSGMCPKRNKGYHIRELAFVGFRKNCELGGGQSPWVVFYARGAETRMRGGFAQFEGSKELSETDLMHYWRGKQLTAAPRDRQANNSGPNFIMGVTMPSLR